MPPDLRSFDAVPFDAPQRERLDTWLSEAGWPRGHMSFAELEGYLVALIAWPVGISSGAWLPPIWGEHGWKIPTKMAAQSDFGEFVDLIAGLMQHLDRELSNRESRFESSVLHDPRGTQQTEQIHCWGRGFMTAVSLGSQGLKWRSDSAGAAVRTIANGTRSPAPVDAPAVAEVVSAVFALMEQRVSRGPLGPLPPGMGLELSAKKQNAAAARAMRARD